MFTWYIIKNSPVFPEERKNIDTEKASDDGRAHVSEVSYMVIVSWGI